MPIKWSALKVNEAMDMVEEFVNEAAEPLEKAEIVAIEARKIPNLPQYVQERLYSLVIEIRRIDNIRQSIKVVCDALPDGAVEEEKKRLENGSQLSLVA